ncbi:LacI family transcriptional regulator [Spirochaetia bacterium]|nr:LacI family transcriptional regulator [Spirochaetia bacterium]
MVTLKDIAGEAGVSAATVSNVVNGNISKVSKANIIRINKIIRDRQYIPNSSARTLAAKSSHIIAGILVGKSGRNMLKDPYNAEFFGEVVSAVQERGYYLMIRYVDSYEEVVHSLRSWNVDGAVFIGTTGTYIKKIREAVKIPLVFTDSYTGTENINNVGIDDFRGGVLAAEFFLRRGHRNLGFLGYVPLRREKNVVTERLDGFRSALLKQGIVMEEKHIFWADSYSPDHLAKVAAVLASGKSGISGLFVSADILAISLMEVLSKQGVRFPDDISLIGFDDLPIAANIRVPLSTIRQDVAGKARIAVDLLFRQIEKKNIPPENIMTELSLVERESVKVKNL